MGIQGLLPLLKSIHKPTHLRSFAGQTLGVDAYGWLHRGTAACAIELAEGTPTRKHIEFALHRVRMLIHFGVKPYLVFDGDYLPSKAHTEKERAARRKDSKKTGLELLRVGRRSSAYLELQKAVDVTAVMARELIEELKLMDVSYVVAPFEADSQLAYLEKQGTIAGVISEDSDLLVFGVQCLLTKLDQYGECVMIRRSDFTACRDISLVGWSDKEFRMMAMLSGCDYLPGIGGMGLKTAYRLVRKHKSIEKVVRSVQFDGKMKVPAGYLEAFQNAERTFLHQWVYSSEDRCLTHLCPLPANLQASDMPYIGKRVDPDEATGVASGHLDPNTKRPIPFTFRSRQFPSSTRVTNTPTEKHGRPISEFFKAQRTPLAELDVNSLTPSPSQQRLLESQQNTSWSASMISGSRAVGISRTASMPAPSSAPQPVRRTATGPLREMMNGTSSKRPRLCSDASLAAALKSSQQSQETVSPFFAKSATQTSPFLRKKSRSSKPEAFELWCDDSAAELVAAATATPESTETLGLSRKKLKVFSDQPPTPLESDVNGDSQDTIITTVSEESRISASVGTPDTSFEDIETQLESDAVSKSTSDRLAGLRSYSYPPPLRATPPEKKNTTLAVTTPISRRGAQAKKGESETRSSEEQQILVAHSSPVDPDKTSAAPHDDRDGIDDEEWLAMEHEIVDGHSTPKLQGSEDLLVPESPSLSEEDRASRPKWNLSRFTFGA